MATRTYRRYSTEFKLQLVRAHLVSDGVDAPRRHRPCNAIKSVVTDWPAYGYRRVAAEFSRRGIIANKAQ